MLKKIVKNKLFQLIICFLLYLYAKLVRVTSLWKVDGYHNIEKLVNSKKPFIFVLWHNRIFMAPSFAPQNTTLNAIISTHSDGELVANFMRFYGIKLIRGSSKKNSFKALKSAFEVLKNNQALVVTPDGPRGPAMKIGGNIIQIAQKTGAPIVIFCYNTKRKIVFSSWDKFILPLPFNKGRAYYSPPIYVDNNSNSTTEVENKMNKIANIIDTTYSPYNI